VGADWREKGRDQAFCVVACVTEDMVHDFYRVDYAPIVSLWDDVCLVGGDFDDYGHGKLRLRGYNAGRWRIEVVRFSCRRVVRGQVVS